MLTIETVDINDVYPPEDEYGNRFISRDYDTKENKAYIDQLAADIKAHGVPEEPVVLVRDRNIYRIKCGNTRVMAMRLNGVQKFEAVIDEDTTPEALLRLAESAYRTNIKKTYSAVEQAKISTQLFAFNKDDLAVAEVMHKPVEEVSAARAGWEIAKEVAPSEVEQLTIDHYKLIKEYCDDEDATERIISAEERELTSIAQDLNQKRKLRELDEVLRNGFALRGIEIANCEEYPDCSYIYWINRESDFDRLDKYDPSAVFLERRSLAAYALYAKEQLVTDDPYSDPECDERKARMEIAESARFEFFTTNFPELPNYAAYASTHHLATYDLFGWSLSNFIERNDLNYEIPTELKMLNVFMREHDELLTYENKIEDPDRAEGFRSTTKVLMADGYIPPEAETLLLAEAEEFLKAQKPAEDEEAGGENDEQ